MRGTRRDARPAARSGRPRCTRGRPSAAHPAPTPSAGRAGAAARACPPRRRPTARAVGSRPGPSGRGSPPPRSRSDGSSILQRLQMSEIAVQAVVGVLADGARVEHHDARVADVVGRTSCRRPPSSRRSAPSRARSSGTRRCGSDTSAPWLRIEVSQTLLRELHRAGFAYDRDLDLTGVLQLLLDLLRDIARDHLRLRCRRRPRA